MAKAQETVSVRMTAHNFERLAKVAAVLGQTPEELLNGALLDGVLERPEGCLKADLLAGAREPNNKEREQWSVLARMADGWKPEGIKPEAGRPKLVAVHIRRDQYEVMQRAAEIVRKIGGDEDNTAEHLLRWFWMSDEGPLGLAQSFVDGVDLPDAKKRAMQKRLDAMRESEPGLDD